jgi:predicted nucleic acid-binding Zn ribbon protein
MRKKLITRDEVRFGERGHILTLPIDSVRDPDSFAPKPIERLWAPLLRSLNRSQCPEPYGFRLTCRHCDGEFFRVKWSNPAYCSDRCHDTAHDARRRRAAAAQTKTTAAMRAEARAGRGCEVCGEPLDARRSTMRFCSAKCRVTSHRAALKR